MGSDYSIRTISISMILVWKKLGIFTFYSPFYFIYYTYLYFFNIKFGYLRTKCDITNAEFYIILLLVIATLLLDWIA
jgi:hypothetical protein